MSAANFLHPTRPGPDQSWRHPDELPAPLFSKAHFVASRYLPMHDGVALAADLYLPKGLPAGTKVPTILYQTRYFRSIRLRSPLHELYGGQPMLTAQSTAQRRHFFASHGFAWLDVDVRGSGASFGTRVCPWSPDELRDGASLMDWIVSQPWSNGEIGAMGISYAGTASEFLMVHHHPALKAIIPRFSLFDTYSDIAFPGGIRNHAFLSRWRELNGFLDANTPWKIVGPWARLFSSGVAPVQEDKDGSLRRQAVAEHAGNYDVYEESRALLCRDDLSPSDPFAQGGGEASVEELLPPTDPEGSIGRFSPHNYAEHARKRPIPIYHWSSWYDGAYGHSAIKRYTTYQHAGSRLLLGPWNHGGSWVTDPASSAVSASQFDHNGEMLLFLLRYLKTPGPARAPLQEEAPVRYFTMVENTWKSAATWPPPQSQHQTWFLGPGYIGSEVPKTEQRVCYKVDPTTTSFRGESSRWLNQAEVDTGIAYVPRPPRQEKRLVFTSTVFATDLEVTGHPVLHLWLASSATDGTFFGYLEDIAPSGEARYVTEGCLRALHRKTLPAPEGPLGFLPHRSFKQEDAAPLVPGEPTLLSFALLPVSYLFRAGHRLRLALAGADADHFHMIPDDPPTWEVHCGPAEGREQRSHLLLPVVR